MACYRQLSKSGSIVAAMHRQRAHKLSLAAGNAQRRELRHARRAGGIKRCRNIKRGENSNMSKSPSPCGYSNRGKHISSRNWHSGLSAAVSALVEASGREITRKSIIVGAAFGEAHIG